MLSRTPLKDLNAIVIGAGFGGLATAIELARRGAKVRIFESSPDLARQGDVIQVGANATRLMKPFGNVLEEISKSCSLPDTMTIMDKQGKTLLNQPLHTDYNGYPNLYGKRGLIQRALYNFANLLGVKVMFGSHVTGLFETSNSAGVIVKDERHEADCVLGADGVRGVARNYVTGMNDRPKKSGFAVYRSWFPLEVLENDNISKEIVASKAPLFKIWIAQDTHAILTTNTSLQAATCFVTHKDESDISEDWNVKGEINDMLACVEDWDPQLRQIIKQIPPDCLIDYKLLWRDPVPNWVSEGGRVCLVGDAAHPHLATSGTGAAQAIEGAATVAVLLEKDPSPSHIPIAFRAYQKLRYERTSLTQRMGWETRHAWHQTDWEAVAANPDVLKLPQPDWLLGHDASVYASEQYDSVIAHVLENKPFHSTNVPKDYVHEDWTIETMLSREGRAAESDFYKTRQ